MSVGRRSLLKLAAAAAVAAGAPVVPEAPAAVLAAPVADPPPVPPMEFGYSLNGGELWNTGFATREEAIEAALEYGEAFSTAEVRLRPITYPRDLPEEVANWLHDPGCPGNAAAGWLSGCNEDSDYEGEFDDACYRHAQELREPVRAAIAAAVRRAGFEDWARAVETEDWPEGNPPEALTDAIEKDQALQEDLLAILVAYAERHALEGELRTLDIEAEEFHEVPEEAETA